MSDVNPELPQSPEAAIEDEVKKTRSEAAQLMDQMEEAAKERGDFFTKFGNREDKDRDGNTVDSRVLILRKGMNLSSLTGDEYHYMKVAFTRNGPRIILGATKDGYSPGDMPVYDFQESRFETQVDRDGRGQDYLMYGWKAQSSERLYGLDECLEKGSLLEFYRRPFWQGPDLERQVTMDQLSEAVNEIIKMNFETPPLKPGVNQVNRATVQGLRDEQKVMGNFSSLLNKPSQPKPNPQ